MKIILGIVLLVAAARAYPVAENEEPKSGVPLVITDYSSVAKSEDLPAQQPQPQDISLESASSESLESSEKPVDEPRITTELPKLEEEKSEETSSQESSNESKPLQDEKAASEEQNLTEAPKLEEPKLEAKPEDKPEDLKPAESIKEEVKEVKLSELPAPLAEDAKLPVSEPLKEQKDRELEERLLKEAKENDLAVKAALAAAEVKIATIDVNNEQITVRVKSALPEKPVADEEKLVLAEPASVLEAAQNPAALAEEPAPLPKSDIIASAEITTTEKIEKPLALPTQQIEEKPRELPAEIKEELFQPNEQKVESAPTVEEILPEQKKLEPVEDKKKAKADNEPALISTTELPSSTTLAAAAPTTVEALKEEKKEEEAKPEALPQPSASS